MTEMFNEVENCAKYCPSQCSDFSENSSFDLNTKKAAMQNTPSHDDSSYSDDGPEFLDNYMDIPERYRMVTIPARCFKVKQDDVLGNTRAKKTDSPMITTVWSFSLTGCSGSTTTPSPRTSSGTRGERRECASPS